MKKILLLLALLPSLVFGAVTNTMTGTNIIPSGSTFTSASGSTSTFSGTLSGTPTGGTWNLSNVGLTLANGVTIGSKTLTLGGNTTVSGSSALTLTTTGATNVTFPTSGTLASTASNFPASQITITMPSGIAQTVQSALYEQMKTPQDYGAVANSTTHPLSDVYGSLAAAQSFYSFAIAGATTTNTSTTVACSSTVTLVVGAPVSGTGIPASTTISSISDSSHFVISNAATASGSPTLTTSFATSLTQELDWAGWQMAVYVNGSCYLPSGVYELGTSTLRVVNPSAMGGQSVVGTGITISGAGVDLTTIVSAHDAIHALGNDQTLQRMTIAGPGSTTIPTRTIYNGVTLGEGNYGNKFHGVSLRVRNFNVGINNPSGWDGCSVENSYVFNNFCNILTDANQDTFRITGTTLANDAVTFPVTGGVTTSGSATISMTSTAGILPGATISGTNLQTFTKVNSVDIDGTHLVLSKSATGSGSSITFQAATIGLVVNTSGKAEWDGGVSGGNGVAIASTNSAASNVHFESCDQIYIDGPSNSFFQLNNVKFADGGGVYRHIDMVGGNAYVEHCNVANPGISGSNGNVYVHVSGTADVFSPDHTAVQDYNDVMLAGVDDFLIQDGSESFPSADAAHHNKRAFMGYASPYWTLGDVIYRCLKNADGGYAWVPETAVPIVSSAVASGSAVSLTTATPANVTSISLTAGTWDVEGNINLAATAATITASQGGISTTTATLPADGTEVYSGVIGTLISETDSVTLPRKTLVLSSTTTVYLVGKSTFSVGAVGAFGSINARRVR